MIDALKNHLPEYLIEAWCLGTFMLSACAFSVLLFNPSSPASGMNAGFRTVLMGVAMGATATAIICSPWGKRSGAHYNPVVTLTFFRLGKIAPTDAAFYIVFQFVGGVLGVSVAWLLLGDLLADSAVNFAVTVPGEYGAAAAFAAEVVIAFFMMTMILWTSNSTRWSRFTPYLAGLFVAFYIAVESPISGMSMNPARTFASASVAGHWSSLWIYFVAPGLAMLAAAEVFIKLRGLKSVFCAKLHHHNDKHCIFNCGYRALATENTEITEGKTLSGAALMN
ncbi:MAG: aquaporin [Pyrinomonadaceae bacterium]